MFVPFIALHLPPTFDRFHKQANSLGVKPDLLFSALMTDAENEPPNWDLQGRQASHWKEYGYLPLDKWTGGGTATRHVSRALEVKLTIVILNKIVLRLDSMPLMILRYHRSRNSWGNLKTPTELVCHLTFLWR